MPFFLMFRAIGIALVSVSLLSANLLAGDVRAVPKLPAQLKNIAPNEIAVPVDLAPVRYPASQAKLKIETVVWVRAFVNKDGEVEKAIIACGEVPSKAFEIAALSATFASTFQPGKRRGKLAYKWFYHPVIFDKRMARKVRKVLRLAKENPSSAEPAITALFANSAGQQSYPGPDDFVPCEIMPEMIKESVPRYPRKARLSGAEGRVWVKALVDKTGTVKIAFAAKTSGNDYLDRAALDSAVKNKFSPARNDGLPVSFWVTYKVDFVIDAN